MEFEEYQIKSKQLAIRPELLDNIQYLAIGLGGESGEVLNELKKMMRDNDGYINQDAREKIKLELGDVLWYITQLASRFDLNMSNIAEENIKKLEEMMKNDLDRKI